MMEQVDIWGTTDRGQARVTNEDAVFFAAKGSYNTEQGGYLLAVADGVASQEEGDVSQVVVDQLAETYYRLNGDDPAGTLQQAIHSTHRATRQTHSNATTLVAAVILNQQIYLANIGNSRAYLIRGETTWQLTKDHVTEDGKLTHYLVGDEAIKPDLFKPIDIGQDDYLLLCSDGLHAKVPESQIVAQFVNGNVQQIGQKLIEQANILDGTDNIAVIVARLAPSPADSRHFSLPQWVTLTALALVIITLLLWLIIELIQLL